MPEPPIVLLAFANDQEGRRYLRDLPEEIRRLREILKQAERDGLCRLELLPNATLDQIFDVFTRNRDRVAIFHFAGHADGGRLLLESGAVGGSPAHAAGLAGFLGQRRGLQLVFLNGCSTRAQAAALLDAGVASVIATARTIDDGAAREFAAAFYTELASGASLRSAYEASRGRMLASRGDAPKAYYRSRDLGDETADAADADPSDDHGFPWEFRPGTELVEQWNLPDAAENPEFGLPRPPERDLPESPFRHLDRFAAEHAEVFFGRGYQIRELYEQVVDPNGPPIVLLYGASGVGKSSLLDAGLTPRLEEGGHAVRYCRRDQKKGLTGTLRHAVPPKAGGTGIVEDWRAEEVGGPLVVFLDQVEEVFTRPSPGQPSELDDFLAALGGIFRDRDARPRGKLVLGFRKEWLAEIDRRLAEANLPRSRMFLRPLDRRGVIEAVRGPAREGRLQRQYHLKIEEGLPEDVAKDLLADAGSALAPTLQVLLTKMWEQARRANPDRPQFDSAIYEILKSQGYLLKDVLDEALKAIAAWDPTVGESGLPLDFLAWHTTELGTAAQRTRAELEARYAHQRAALDGLIGCCKDCYLILEAEPVPGGNDRSTRLAHDLLAPLVQQRFRTSLAPGQRARRLLENRAPEWIDADGKPRDGAPLEAFDLQAVESGLPGMRAIEPAEERLLAASREAERLQVEAKLRRIEFDKQQQDLLDRTREEKELEAALRLKEQEEANAQLKQAAEDQKEANRRLQTSVIKQNETNDWLKKSVWTLVILLASAVAIGYFAYWQWREAEKQIVEVVEQGQVYGVAFSVDGRIAVAYCLGGVGGGVAVLEPGETRFYSLSLSLEDCSVYSPEFGPDGRLVAAHNRGDSAGVALLDADPLSWRRKAVGAANRNFTWSEWTQYFPDDKRSSGCEVYRRTSRSFAWPGDLTEDERRDAEEYEKTHPEGDAEI